MTTESSAPFLLRKNALLFLGTMILSTGSITAIGWLTSLRMILYGVILTCSTFTLIPFVLILAGILLPILFFLLFLTTFILSLFLPLISSILPLLGQPVSVSPPIEKISFADPTYLGAQISGYGLSILRPFYSWFWHIRHPAFWGISAGLILGCALLALLLFLFILPGEKVTAETLTLARESVIAHHAKHRILPLATDGYLRLDNANPIQDGFGRPLRYEVHLMEFRIKSVGFNGYPGGFDDLCIHGEVDLTKKQLAIAGRQIAEDLFKQRKNLFKDGKLNLRFKLNRKDAAELIQSLRCNE